MEEEENRKQNLRKKEALEDASHEQKIYEQLTEIRD